MTNITTPACTPDLTTPLAVDDPRPFFARAVATAGETIAGVNDDQFCLPTPCDDFDVRDMLGHLVEVMQRLAVVSAGGDPFHLGQEWRLGSAATVADWSAAWAVAAHRVQEVWTEDVLDRLLTLPWATLPGRVALAIYTNEVTVHTWDLAIATGQSPAWHEPTLALAYEAIRIGLPAEGRTALIAAAISEMDESVRDEVEAEGAPFGDVVAVPADAPLIDLLVAWNGRRP